MLNRFLVENVVDIDMASRRLYVEGGDGALILIDLAAAFPSLSQDFMFKVLE